MGLSRYGLVQGGVIGEQPANWRRTVDIMAADANLEKRLDHLDAAVDGLFQVVNAIANNAPALANGRGPLDEIRKGLGDVAVALKAAREA
jgi:hypothetical protein